MLTITVTQNASSSLAKDLRTNGIEHTYIKGFTTLQAIETPKLRMAIQMVRERFGMQSIIVKP